MADELEIWREMRRLDGQHGVTALQVAGHLGECTARHAEIQRRFETADSARSELRAALASENATLRAEVAETKKTVDALKGRILGLAITVAGGSLAVIAQIVLQSTHVLK